MNNFANSRNSFTAWAIVAIIGLLGLNAYQWFNISQLKKQSSVQQSNLSELQKAQVELDQDYNDALERLEELRGDNKEANDLIDSQKKELEIQKAKISDMIWTKRELGRAKEEMSKLNTQVNDYVAQIQKLSEENTKLTESNTQLTTANQTLTTNLETEKKEKDEIAQARAVLVSEKDKLSKDNENLSGKVDVASAVKINTITVTGFDIRKEGKVKEKSKAKDVEMLRICFTTEANLITASGNKKFYVRIVNPSGQTVAVEDKGSGSLTNKIDNSEVRYTTSGDIQYSNKSANACIDWNLPNQLTKGNYTVEMFNNGYPVGTGSFILK